jgi:succinylarginine dihydrolase
LLSDLGFRGTLQQQLTAALHQSPQALSAAFSSAFMWVANAATVTPTIDSADGRFHCTPANLLSSWHRGSEASERRTQLEILLAGLGDKAVVHPPLPAIVPLRDEGAANHMRLCDPSGRIGFNVFVYGENESERRAAHTQSFFARHTRAAAEAVARKHQLPSDRTFLIQQHPRAIDAGVFHNDVIATSCDHLLIHHQYAFIDAEAELQRLETRFHQQCEHALLRIEVSDDELPLADAVRSYFFNSQIIRLPTSGSAARYTLLLPIIANKLVLRHD